MAVNCWLQMAARCWMLLMPAGWVGLLAGCKLVAADVKTGWLLTNGCSLLDLLLAAGRWLAAGWGRVAVRLLANCQCWLAAFWVVVTASC
jgi:hypothetical protein